jgi:hypothetical protein
MHRPFRFHQPLLPGRDSADTSAVSEFWFVVDPGNDQLYEALERVLAGRPGLHVVRNRRSPDAGRAPGGERRKARVWKGDELVIAEDEGFRSS